MNPAGSQRTKPITSQPSSTAAVEPGQADGARAGSASAATGQRAGGPGEAGAESVAHPVSPWVVALNVEQDTRDDPVGAVGTFNDRRRQVVSHAVQSGDLKLQFCSPEGISTLSPDPPSVIRGVGVA